MATVTLQSISKKYGNATALDAVDLHVEDGELMTLVGPSGCGKSTALAIVAGLEAPTAGDLRIDGVSVVGWSPRERNVAMVFQSYALYPHRTVRGNLAFPLEVAGVARREITARVEETAALLAITPLLERRPRELSGGQRQRVALGRALVRRPQLCLFDEPLSNLDAALRTQLRAELKRLHAQLGATFIYVTHDQAEAMTLSDRVAVLDRGRLQQVGAPRVIYEQPANETVAAFFGTPRMNLVSPERLRLAAPAAAVRAGVRAEHVSATVTPDGAGAGLIDGPALVSGRVIIVEPMGAEAWVHVDVGGDVIVARAPGAFTAASGQAAWLRVDAEHVLWFDAAGRRLAEPRVG